MILGLKFTLRSCSFQFSFNVIPLWALSSTSKPIFLSPTHLLWNCLAILQHFWPNFFLNLIPLSIWYSLLHMWASELLALCYRTIHSRSHMKIPLMVPSCSSPSLITKVGSNAELFHAKQLLTFWLFALTLLLWREELLCVLYYLNHQ